ncbi:hypothetical protein TBR22_A29960 [Luteitalea sp. TBR-22]|uniref:hypothetical protein n=1 Tax=Luteitalea sp. TBR-22 TaxID=2802971 RepID=UPI001AF54F02|nr:hypothetical protein [Luteitalea sp. TBR-22]BCS33769.1 hypothetical protein TBR22_A29960 [Luteitalea sp. TBR-22]
MPLIDRVLSVLASPTPGIPLLIGGCSAGRTHALHGVLARLDGDTTPVYLDVERLATTPEQCYRSLLRHVRVAEDGPALPAPASLATPRDAYAAILVLLTRARAASGRPFTFLLDEVLDLRTFESFPGLKTLMAETGSALGASENRFVLATRFRHRGTKLAGAWPRVTPVLLDDAADDERDGEALAGLDPLERQQVRALTGGRVGYAVLVGAALREARRHGLADPVGALTEQMLCGSALERRLRLSYEVRLQRARGYGALRAILDVLSEQQPLTLTQIAQRLNRTPGSTKDYLSWMLDVDLLTVERKRYTVTDPLLRLWVRLNNGPGAPSDALVARETQRFALERLATLPDVAVAVARPASSPGGIIEID